MPSIPFATSSYERGEGDLPPLPLRNMYAEEAPTEQRGIVLQSRPGLADRGADMGAGPVQQLFKRDGVLGSQLFGVSGGRLYQDTTDIGAIDGEGFCSIAGNEIGIMATAGAGLWFYNGSTLSQVSFPDSADVAHVSVGGARYWMVRKDTGKVYWTDPLEADVEALDFATAETLPDRTLQTLWIDGSLVIFGAESVELWQQTGNAELPIRPLINMVYEKGLKATGCAAAIGSSFAWVTNENNVCLQNESNIISNVGLQERIAASSECRLFTFTIDGVEFLALRMAFSDGTGETQVWSLRSGQWSEFDTYGQTNWAAQCFAGGVFGSAVDGKTLGWSGRADAYAANGILERLLTGGMRPAQPLSISNLALLANPGNTSYLTGEYANPKVELRVSRDEGKTWSDWADTTLGAQGEYRTEIMWRALGMTPRRRGWMCQIRVADPVDFRVSDLQVNAGYGGR